MIGASSGAGNEHRPIEVIRLNRAGQTSASLAASLQAAANLASYGYCLSDCQEALSQCSNDADAALRLLYSALAGESSRTCSMSAACHSCRKTASALVGHQGHLKCVICGSLPHHPAASHLCSMLVLRKASVSCQASCSTARAFRASLPSDCRPVLCQTPVIPGAHRQIDSLTLRRAVPCKPTFCISFHK